MTASRRASSRFKVQGSRFPVPGWRLLGRRTRRSTRTRTLNLEPGTWNLCDLFAPYVLGLLVIPQPEVDGMPQDIVGGPLSEANLCDELRLNPVGLLVRWRTAAERVFLDCQRLEERRQPGQFLLVESRSHVTDINERAVLVHAEQQRAKILARFSRLGPAADDEFLFLDDLEFAPVGRALPGHVSRCRQLRDESLPAARECAVVQRPPISFGDFAQPENRRSRTSEHLLEHVAAFNERPAAEVDGTSLEEI